MGKKETLTFLPTADLKERIDDEVVRRTVERRRSVTTSEVVRDALERALPRRENDGSGGE